MLSKSFFKYILFSTLLIPQLLQSQITPDSVGFFIYSDDFSSGFIGENWSGGIVDFQSTDSPNNGNYCIRWDDADLYGAINIDFNPNRNFSYLVENNYALDLMVRGNNNDIWFDIRFLDTDEGTDDHPWRMRATLNQNHGPWDGRWHHLHIPLDEMGEQGSWDDNMWHLPIGAFDWSAIDRLQFVADIDPLDEKSLWFDNIHTTELDTALVYDNSVFGVITSLENVEANIDFEIYPNPTTAFITIKTQEKEEFIFEMKNMEGKTVLTSSFFEEETIDLTNFAKGIYWLNLGTKNNLIKIQKIILQ